MRRLQIRNSLILFLTAVIWGVAFVAQSVGMDYVGPFTFICVRSLIGGIVLIPCIAFLNRREERNEQAEISGTEGEPGKQKRKLLLGGICCGLALCFASCFQQFGILYTTVGKAGFITAFYIIIVPSGTFLRKKMRAFCVGRRGSGTGRSLFSVHW